MKHIKYHNNGSVWAKGEIVNAVMEGHWEFFRKDGVMMRSGNFKNGKQVGEWITYDKSGNIYKKTKFCSRGHKYTGSGPCPICWPGRIKKS